MTDEGNTLERIRTLFHSGLNLEVPSVDTDLFEEGLLDSLGLVELLLHIERELGVEVPLEEVELEIFRSVRTIATYVSERLGSDLGRAAQES